MNLQLKAEIAGRFRLEISGGERGLIELDWQDNMVLDQGIQTFLTKSNFYGILSYVGVGTSSQPVVPTDTGLIAPLKRYPNPVVSHSGDNATGRASSVWKFTFPRGQAAGNISELSIGTGDNNTSAVCRALTKDSAGNPTTITVLPDEVLTVTWELSRWWMLPDAHTITYDNDGTPAVTTVTYLPLSQISQYGLSSGVGGQLISTGVARLAQSFTESQGNPAITGSSPPRAGQYGMVPQPLSGYTMCTFTPPIQKTTEFTVTILWQVTLSRRGE